MPVKRADYRKFLVVVVVTHLQKDVDGLLQQMSVLLLHVTLTLDAV
jgi:hypothetical protein